MDCCVRKFYLFPLVNLCSLVYSWSFFPFTCIAVSLPFLTCMKLPVQISRVCLSFTIIVSTVLCLVCLSAFPLSLSLYLLSSPASSPHLPSGRPVPGCFPSCSPFFHICTFRACPSSVFLHIREYRAGQPFLTLSVSSSSQGCTVAAHLARRSAPPAVLHLSAITR